MTEAPAKDAIPLGKNRFVAVKQYRGHRFLDIREYFINDKNKLQPGLKGVTLKQNQWVHFKDSFSAIDDKLVSTNNLSVGFLWFPHYHNDIIISSVDLLDQKIMRQLILEKRIGKTRKNELL